ncbi:MAG TPA: hypothetical protein VFF65_10060 [Phycisphaerales bacterium]|nr:hypothetical protein [Phycisphaerales bacterium]
MLSDDRLQQLLRDAHALESFERGGGTPAVKTRSRRVWWAVKAAAVLAVAGAVVLVVGNRPAPSPPADSIVSTVKPPVAPVPAENVASLLLAVYQDDDGTLSCVNWSSDALKGRAIASMTADELTRMGLALACDPQAARILVVGLEGPAAALPSSDARAQVVAECLSTTPPCAPGTFNPRTCASAGCLDTEVKVRIAAMALK